MNGRIIDTTKINECPFPINFHVPSTTTPAAGTHTVFMDDECYGKFLKELGKVSAHVNKVFMALIVMDQPKKTRSDLDLNIDGPKHLKLSSEKKTSMVLFSGKQVGVPNGGNLLPESGSVTPLGDSPSVETCVGYSFGGNLNAQGKS